MPSERDTFLNALRARVEQHLASVPGGAARWAHCERVHGLARHLARQEGADRFVVGAAALLHEVAWDGTAASGEQLAADLQANGLTDATAMAIVGAIAALQDADAPTASQEGLLLRDAHVLDELGAVGIANVLLGGGEEGIALYDRTDPFALLRPLDPDQALVDRLYAQLSALPRRMQSEAARQIAIRRSGIMLFYLESLRDELAETTPDALLPESDWLVPRDERDEH